MTDKPGHRDFAYRELAVALRQRAAQMEPHAPLPSLSHLCQEYGRSPKTVRKAIRLLAQDGIVYVVPGLGTFVSPRP